MSIKLEPVEGATPRKKGDTTWGNDTSKRPVMHCDAKPGCKCTVQGNAGEDEASLVQRAFSHGWTTEPPGSGKHVCTCASCKGDGGKK